MALIEPLETHQYTKDRLSEHDVAPNPTDQFRKWFSQAREAGVVLPEAVSLATAELPSGRVSVRVVLMKELDADGNFVIYSNWADSRKAADFRTNPNVALSFWWKELERAIRIEGKATRMSREESEVYYQSRPRGSQIGAWASKQSQPAASREEIEDAVRRVEEEHKGEDVLPCPPFWGGIRIKPDRWEFWQGRTSRVHDRIQYVENEDGSWSIDRLNP